MQKGREQEMERRMEVRPAPEPTAHQAYKHHALQMWIMNIKISTF